MSESWKQEGIPFIVHAGCKRLCISLLPRCMCFTNQTHVN